MMEQHHFTDITVRVDGDVRSVKIDNRITLLDLLREQLGVTAPKKGCDHGQCGSCTVILDGRRSVICLALAVAHDGADIVTAAGLGDTDALHPLARSFVEHDGFQCGYCTPGQICSAIGMLDEMNSGAPSYVTDDIEREVDVTDDEIRERMSGNLCRCAAYPNIVAAIRTAVL
jgi:xanthine dehydrogenase YagT iron-sulfur-binding subunit